MDYGIYPRPLSPAGGTGFTVSWFLTDFSVNRELTTAHEGFRSGNTLGIQYIISLSMLNVILLHKNLHLTTPLQLGWSLGRSLGPLVPTTSVEMSVSKGLYKVGRYWSVVGCMLCLGSSGFEDKTKNSNTASRRLRGRNILTCRRTWIHMKQWSRREQLVHGNLGEKISMNSMIQFIIR